MIRLFPAATFLSATLLFMVQPLAGRILLPVLGGSPTVWSTCMVFFQAVLLLGYLYAHALSTHVAGTWQRPIHLGVLAAAGLMLPLAADIGEPGSADPRWWALRTLALTAGLPFFALSATAPLLQRWFSRSSDPRAGDPYFLYAASNAGSLLGLLGYLVIEPMATRGGQAAGWAVGFWLVTVLVAGCAYAATRHPAKAKRLPAGRGPARARQSSPADPAQAARALDDIALTRRTLWIVLALVPSAMLLGVTQHLATDVVSAPLLWVVPLALYLATFMAAFSAKGLGSAHRWGSGAPAAALVVLILSLAEVRYPIVPLTLVHLAAFTVLAMMCHTRLAESRPDPAHLTGYFVCVALGGALGGVAAALIAPAVFSSILEYPVAIAAALLLRPQSVQADRGEASARGRWAFRAAALILLVGAYWCVSAFSEVADSSSLAAAPPSIWLRSLSGDDEAAQRVIRAALAVPAVLLLLTARTALLFAATTAGLLIASGVVRTGGAVLARERTFFGVHQVTAAQNGTWHVLTHGTTTHGVQAMQGKVHLLPTAYYHPTGPIGDVIFTLGPEGRLRDVGVIGLGAGALAAYAGTGIRMDFFEIDEAVIRIAENPRYFTYLADARARPGAAVRALSVDGRLGVRAMPPASYDLIVVDAFSSDAIPTHLITREAVALYESRLKPRGLIAFHLSNRFFDLPPVVAGVARDLGLVCYARDDREVEPEKAREGKRASVWVVLARGEDDLGQLARSAPRWLPLTSGGDGTPVWTDDYTNVLRALH